MVHSDKADGAFSLVHLVQRGGAFRLGRWCIQTKLVVHSVWCIQAMVHLIRHPCRAAAVAANSGVSTLRHKGLIEVLPTTLLSSMVAHIYSRDDCSDGGIT